MDIIAVIMIMCIDMFYPLFVRESFIYAAGDNNVILLFIVLSIFIFLIRYFSQVIHQYYGNKFGSFLEHKLRTDIFKKIQYSKIRELDKYKKSEIIYSINNDVDNLSEVSHYLPEEFFMSIILIIGSLINIANLNLRLAVILMILIPIMIIVSSISRKKLLKHISDARSSISSLSAFVDNNFSGIRIIKTFLHEESQISSFIRNSDIVRRKKNIGYKSQAFFSSNVNLLSNLFYIIVIGFGFNLINNSMFKIADLITYLLYVNLFLNAIRRITVLTKQFASGKVGYDRISAIFNLSNEMENQNFDNMLVNETINFKNLEFNNVDFEYTENQKVISKMKFRINKNDEILFAGVSGSGKSTLIRLILRFYNPQEGEILLNGNNILDYSIYSIRRIVSVVEQNIFLFDDSLEANLKLGNPNIKLEEIVKICKKVKIHKFISNLSNDYQTIVGPGGYKLSGGQKQRIALARALIKESQIIIFDEATSAIDRLTEAKINKDLAEILNNKTIIRISHNLGSYKSTKKIIVINDNGEVTNVGSHEKLIQECEVYKELYYAV